MSKVVTSVNECLEKAVSEARAGPTLFADPDFFVGPVGGRYVTMLNTYTVASQISHAGGVKTEFFILAVEQGDLLYVVGGSHRLQVVCGMFPAQRLPYKKIETGFMFEQTGERFDIMLHSAYVIGAIQKSESHPIGYSALEDCIQFMDVLKQSKRYRTDQLRLMEERGIDVTMKTTASTHLKFYESGFSGMCRVLDIESDDLKRRKILRGFLKLAELDDVVFQRFAKFIMVHGIQFTSAQLMTLSNWNSDDIRVVVETCITENDRLFGGKFRGQKVFIRRHLEVIKGGKGTTGGSPKKGKRSAMGVRRGQRHCNVPQTNEVLPQEGVNEGVGGTVGATLSNPVGTTEDNARTADGVSGKRGSSAEEENAVGGVPTL